MVRWVEASRPATTKSTYYRYQVPYLEFCEIRKLPAHKGTTLAAFMMERCEVRKNGRKTCNQVIPAAVADLFRYHDSGLKPTQDPLVKEVKNAITRLTKASKSKRPLLLSQIKKLSKKVDIKDRKYNKIRDFFMVLLMFYGLMRRSEIVNLEEGVWLEYLEGEWVLVITVTKSKTDQGREGHTILLSAAGQVGFGTSFICRPKHGPRISFFTPLLKEESSCRAPPRTNL